MPTQDEINLLETRTEKYTDIIYNAVMAAILAQFGPAAAEYGQFVKLTQAIKKGIIASYPGIAVLP